MKAKMAGSLAQEVEHLSSKRPRVQNPGPPEKKKKKKKCIYQYFPDILE
jgi:hypothetical protein